MSKFISCLPLKVTKEAMLKRTVDAMYTILPDGKTTVCTLFLENGFTIQGTSSCVVESQFDMVKGRQYAYKDAVEKLWPLEGYLLAESRWQEKKAYEQSKVILDNLNKIPGTDENWDNRLLGADPATAQRSSPEAEAALAKAVSSGRVKPAY